MRSGAAAFATSLEGEDLRMVTEEEATVGDRELVALAPTLLAAARYHVRSE